MCTLTSYIWLGILRSSVLVPRSRFVRSFFHIWLSISLHFHPCFRYLDLNRSWSSTFAFPVFCFLRSDLREASFQYRGIQTKYFLNFDLPSHITSTTNIHTSNLFELFKIMPDNYKYFWYSRYFDDDKNDLSSTKWEPSTTSELLCLISFRMAEALP